MANFVFNSGTTRAIYSILTPRRLASFLTFIILVFTLLTGCNSATSTSETKIPGTSAIIETGDKYQIAVYRGTTQVGILTLEKLADLEKVKFSADGKNEEGPRLTAALTLTGIGDFQKITIYGYAKGRIATAELTLQKADITDKTILDFSNQGTCKLAGDTIPSNNWIIDVNKMVVE